MIKTVIVEDDLMVASLNAQFAYKTPGVEVTASFHSGKEALSYLRDNRADLLLLDLYMPDINGLELLKTLRERGDNVGVIMITAANDAEHIEKAMHLGIVDYLVKPFRYERFSAAIQRYMLRRRLMEKDGAFTQEDIDRLLPLSSETAQAMGMELRKGIQPKTLEMIRTCLAGHPREFLSCDRLAEETGLSKVTVRHYLSYMIERHEAVSRINYLTGGHPSTEYSGVPS